MVLPKVFHGDVIGTMEGYGPRLGMESLSGSPSSVTICKRLMRTRRVSRATEKGDMPPSSAHVG
jgi:hypothetical protein